MTLREYLQLRGLTEQQAADNLGTTRQRINMICNGDAAGRKLAARIERWTGGAVTRLAVLYPDEYASN